MIRKTQKRWLRKKSQKPLFRHSGPPEADKLQPESRFFEDIQNAWTPVFTGVRSSFEDAKEYTDKFPLAKEVPSPGASETCPAIHELLCLSTVLYGRAEQTPLLSGNPPFVSSLRTVSVTQRVSHETCPSPKVIAVILMFTKAPL
jgi:hypothetical protein